MQYAYSEEEEDEAPRLVPVRDGELDDLDAVELPTETGAATHAPTPNATSGHS